MHAYYRKSGQLSLQIRPKRPGCQVLPNDSILAQINQRYQAQGEYENEYIIRDEYNDYGDLRVVRLVFILQDDRPRDDQLFRLLWTMYHFYGCTELRYYTRDSEQNQWMYETDGIKWLCHANGVEYEDQSDLVGSSRD
ncbi:MAG: hypothetical protein JWN38_91 [Candidatus Saccharibacteria bacterium]|nr:hypothetical protein [Candidatus Saccharibacteria bacterium]